MTHAVSFGPIDPSTVRCAACGYEGVHFAADMQVQAGDQFVFGSPLPLCAACAALLADRDEDGLLDRLTEEADHWGRQVYARQLVLRCVRIDAVRPGSPEIARLREAGYEALEQHTGVGEQLGPLWPAGHRMAVPDDRDWTDGTAWFVRSPWPGITVGDIFGRLLWRWVERDDLSRRPDVWAQRVTEALSWNEAEARGFMESGRA